MAVATRVQRSVRSVKSMPRAYLFLRLGIPLLLAVTERLLVGLWISQGARRLHRVLAGVLPPLLLGRLLRPTLGRRLGSPFVVLHAPMPTRRRQGRSLGGDAPHRLPFAGGGAAQHTHRLSHR